MIYVVAGTQEQAYQYINRKIEERVRNGEEVSKISDYAYVRDVTILRGVSNPRGVFIGTWKERKDIIDIVQQLMMQQDVGNPALRRIWEELTIEDDHTKPLKLKPVKGGWVNEQAGIDYAAELLSQAIDAEALHIMIKMTMDT